MEAGFIALTIVVSALTMVLGIFLGINLGKTKTSVSKTQGVVHVDHGDGASGPWLYLETRAPICDIIKQKQVTFDVNVVK